MPDKSFRSYVFVQGMFVEPEVCFRFVKSGYMGRFLSFWSAGPRCFVDFFPTYKSHLVKIKIKHMITKAHNCVTQADVSEFLDVMSLQQLFRLFGLLVLAFFGVKSSPNIKKVANFFFLRSAECSCIVFDLCNTTVLALMVLFPPKHTKPNFIHHNFYYDN